MLSGTARRTSSSIGGRPYRPSGSTASRGRANSFSAQLEVRREQLKLLPEQCGCDQWIHHPGACNVPDIHRSDGEACCWFWCCKNHQRSHRCPRGHCSGHWDGDWHPCIRHGSHRGRQWRSWRITHHSNRLSDHGTVRACQDAFFHHGGIRSGHRHPPKRLGYRYYNCFFNPHQPGCTGHGYGWRITQWRDCYPHDHDDHDDYGHDDYHRIRHVDVPVPVPRPVPVPVPVPVEHRALQSTSHLVEQESTKSLGCC
mmetsp:Transcript_16914/g.41922  ORF Transcript_16914/g.41922 Transcript_16914/m.41922 type:complete len:255 (-) Transcript_16914:495-1259(-)